MSFFFSWLDVWNSTTSHWIQYILSLFFVLNKTNVLKTQSVVLNLFGISRIQQRQNWKADSSTFTPKNTWLTLFTTRYSMVRLLVVIVRARIRKFTKRTKFHWIPVQREKLISLLYVLVWFTSRILRRQN